MTSGTKDDLKSLFRVRYHKKVIKFVCNKIAAGVTLTSICRNYFGKNPLIPEFPKTIYRWINKYPEFKKAYTEAMRVRYLVLHDHIVDLADEPPPDTGDFRRDQTISRQREFKTRTLLALSGQLASKYVPELQDKKEVQNNAPIIRILNYYKQDSLEAPVTLIEHSGINIDNQNQDDT